MKAWAGFRWVVFSSGPRLICPLPSCFGAGGPSAFLNPLLGFTSHGRNVEQTNMVVREAAAKLSPLHCTQLTQRFFYTRETCEFSPSMCGVGQSGQAVGWASCQAAITEESETLYTSVTARLCRMRWRHSGWFMYHCTDTTPSVWLCCDCCIHTSRVWITH